MPDLPDRAENALERGYGIMFRRLRLRDFRSHGDLALDLTQPVTLIYGPNGSGKTSILYALEYLLAGRCELTDARGAGADVLIRGYPTPAGARKAAVEAELEDLGLVRREVPNKLRVPGTPGGIREAEAGLQRALRIHRDLLAVALSPGRLANMGKDDLGDLLFTVAAGPLDKETMVAAVDKYLYEEADISGHVAERALAAAREMIPARPNRKTIDRLHRTAYDERREAKGRVKSLEAQIMSLEQAAQAQSPSGEIDAEAVRRRLATYRAERERLQAEIIRAEQVQREMQLAQQALAAAEQDLRIKRQKTGVSQGDGRPGDEAQLRHRIQVLGEDLRRIETGQSSCPVYQGVPCPLSSQDLEQYAATVKRERETLIAELAAVVVHDAVRAVAAARQQLQSIQVPDVRDARQRLEGLRRLEESDTALLEALAGAAAHLQGTRQAKAALDVALADAAMYGALVKCFETGGIKTILLQDKMNALQERINRNLSELLDASWAVTFQEDPPVLVRHPHHAAAPLRSLSSGERTLVCLAIAAALVERAEFWLLALDDAEHVDAPTFRQVMQVLRTWASQGRYATILVLFAGEPPAVDGVEYLSLSTGPQQQSA